MVIRNIIGQLKNRLCRGAEGDAYKGTFDVTRRGTTIALIVAVLVVGTALQIVMLGQDVRFHSDEALYATFARRISQNGDFLLSDAPLDKPPLAIITVALSFSLLGSTEFAARLPSFFASLITLAATYTLARRLYGVRTARLAALLLALCPFDLAFAATVFLDPLLIMWLILACLAVSRDRWRAAGIACMLAVATKQTAIAFVPLIIMLGICCNAETGWRFRHYAGRLINFAFPILIGGIVLTLWSATRAAPIDFWTLGAINNTPDRLIRANEILLRLEKWLSYLANVTGFAPLLALAFVPLVTRKRSRETLLTILLVAFILAVLLGYWLIAFNTYDRYLLPLTPLLLLLVAHGAQRLPRIVPILAVICMLPFTVNAMRGQLNIGGDRGQHNDIDRLALAINSLPAGTVIYDYSLDWELGFYLGSRTKVRMVFQPTPQALARAVCATANPSYFASPSVDSRPWLLPLWQRDGTASLLAEGPFQLYRLDCPF
jgi:4-amino-4-deoxy-L-arabinose transferase-like glycosyltransferase